MKNQIKVGCVIWKDIFVSEKNLVGHTLKFMKRIEIWYD